MYHPRRRLLAKRGRNTPLHRCRDGPQTQLRSPRTQLCMNPTETKTKGATNEFFARPRQAVGCHPGRRLQSVGKTQRAALQRRRERPRMQFRFKHQENEGCHPLIPRRAQAGRWVPPRPPLAKRGRNARLHRRRERPQTPLSSKREENDGCHPLIPRQAEAGYWVPSPPPPAKRG